MAPGKIRWDGPMTLAHAAYHKDEEKAKQCKLRYWKWLTSETKNAGNSQSFNEVCGCEMLNPDQHKVGYQLAKDWFQKAQSAAGGRLEMLKIPDAYWPQESRGHEDALVFVQDLAKEGKTQKDIHAAAINKHREEERRKAEELASKAMSAQQTDQGSDPDDIGFIVVRHNKNKMKRDT